MRFIEIKKNKKRYLKLLLLADEQESMIDRYLDRGQMYILQKGNETVAECVVTDEGHGVLEIKNLAVAPPYQKQGYGKEVIAFLKRKYHGRFQTLRVGTGDSPLTLPFYQKCGFAISGRKRNFFTKNYDHPIYEAGRKLRDMIYLQQKI